MQARDDDKNTLVSYAAAAACDRTALEAILELSTTEGSTPRLLRDEDYHGMHTTSRIVLLKHLWERPSLTWEI